MFTITPTAAEQIKSAARQGGTEGMALRFAAGKREDGTIEYKMGFDEATEEDVMLVCEGLDVVMEPHFLPLLETATLDFVALDSGDFQFVFLNPQDPSFVPPQDS